MEWVGQQRNLVLILARAFAAQLATAVFLLDPEGTIIYYNEAGERLTGRPFIEGAGQTIDEWMMRRRPRDEEGLELPIREGLALESRLFAELFGTEDQKIGMTSFLENGPGKAQFTGR